MKSDSIKELASALSKVKFGEIGKNKSVKVALKSGGSYNFQYAPLEVIMSAIRRPLADQGLSLTQTVARVNEGWVVCTMLMHSSGEWLESVVPVVVPQKFDQQGKPIDSTAQEFGSGTSYARRYGVTLICCLVADEDDDANIADGNEVKEIKKAFAEPHKPTDGAWESMAPDMRTFLTDLSNEARSLLMKGDFRGAAEHINESNLDNDTKVALWTRFDSKERAALKKSFEEIRVKETA